MLLNPYGVLKLFVVRISTNIEVVPKVQSVMLNRFAIPLANRSERSEEAHGKLREA